MKIPKAIELLNYHRAELDAHIDADTQDAIKLGIEALKRCKACSPPFGVDDHSPLPGETPVIDNTRSFHHIKETLESPEVRK